MTDKLCSDCQLLKGDLKIANQEIDLVTKELRELKRDLSKWDAICFTILIVSLVGSVAAMAIFK